MGMLSTLEHIQVLQHTTTVRMDTVSKEGVHGSASRMAIGLGKSPIASVRTSRPKCFLLVEHVHHPGVDCGDPGTPRNGRRLLTGSVVKYYCNSGYRLVGSWQRKCQSNGKWSRSLPSCKRETENTSLQLACS